MAATIHSLVEWWAGLNPEQIALSSSGDGVTFSDFNDWVDRVSTRLTSYGIGPGDRVGIFGVNSLHFAAATIGIIKTGAMSVPLNSRYSDQELVSVTNDSGVKLVIVDDEAGDRFEAVLKGIKVIRMAEIRSLRTGPKTPFKGAEDEDAAIVIAYTSGSTAQPKGVIFTHRTVLGYAFESSLSDPAYRAGAKMMLFAPMFAGAGTVNLMLNLAVGMTAFIEAQFDPDKALRTVMENKVDIFSGVPIFFERMAQSPLFADADLSTIKRAVVGGARVPPALLKAYQEKGVILRQLYGLTEGGGTTSAMDPRTAHLYPEKAGKGGPFTKHRIVDADDNDVPLGQQGEIVVRGPSVMAGYWQNPEATAHTMRNGWLHTGDIGVADELGQITVVDRMKDIIISGGLNIASIDVENAIQQIEGVLEVAVIAANDAKFGETPLAIVCASKDVTVQAIIEHCNKALSDYKVPRYVALRTEPLPRLGNGKISKPALREAYKNATETLEKVR